MRSLLPIFRSKLRTCRTHLDWSKTHQEKRENTEKRHTFEDSHCRSRACWQESAQLPLDVPRPAPFSAGWKPLTQNTQTEKKNPHISKRLPSFLPSFFHFVKKQWKHTHRNDLRRVVKTLHYSIPPSSFCTRQSPTVSCLETAVLIYDHFQMHETQSKNSWRRELWMFQTRTTSPPIVGSCAEEAPCEICELLDCACARDAPCFPLPRSNSPRASPSPAACTQPGGTTNVHYTRRIRLDVFHIQEYVLIMI
jgi:hypothetical protein